MSQASEMSLDENGPTLTDSQLDEQAKMLLATLPNNERVEDGLASDAVEGKHEPTEHEPAEHEPAW